MCVSLQLKELRSRVADMEGQSRSSAGVSQLESKVQELEERLRSEERYIFNISQSNTGSFWNKGLTGLFDNRISQIS